MLKDSGCDSVIRFLLLTTRLPIRKLQSIGVFSKQIISISLFINIFSFVKKKTLLTVSYSYPYPCLKFLP